MSEAKNLDIYLNDHLAGSSGAIEVAKRCIDQNAGMPLAQFLTRLLAEIEQDQKTLADLMDRCGTPRNPFKQAGAWLGEKVSRLKLGTEARELSNLLTLESLSLGIEGKACLWRSLKQVSASHEGLAGTDFDALIQRAETQRADLERERLALAAAALGTPAPV
jgi:hypothetical protein